MYKRQAKNLTGAQMADLLEAGGGANSLRDFVSGHFDEYLLASAAPDDAGQDEDGELVEAAVEEAVAA